MEQRIDLSFLMCMDQHNRWAVFTHDKRMVRDGFTSQKEASDFIDDMIKAVIGALEGSGKEVIKTGGRDEIIYRDLNNPISLDEAVSLIDRATTH